MPLNPVPNYPASLDSLPDPTNAIYEDDDGFEIDLLLQKHNGILEALEVKVGAGASVPTTTGQVLSVTGAGATAYQHAVLSTLEAALSGNVALNNTSNFFDGPSLSLGAGTWLVVGAVTVIDTAGGANFLAKLWDGTSVEASGQVTTGAANAVGTIPLMSIITVVSTTTWKISANDATSTSGSIRSAVTGGSNTASYLRAVRVG